MSLNWVVPSSSNRLAALWFFCGTLLVAVPAGAVQIDIHGPARSGAFGTLVVALPNGNFVVTDPDYGSGKKIGAVYLYSPTRKLISVLTGRVANDHVGNFGITVLANGNFVVLSPLWSNGKNAAAGAVTWVNGSSGLSDIVSASNSLVGTTTNDNVGNGLVTLLNNGNYVVSSYAWNNGSATSAGAVTWVNGSTGMTGAVTVENSLVGTAANEGVGYQVTPLSNGNYVVANPAWSSTMTGSLGAVMLAKGYTGATGVFSASNSLVGANAGDVIGSGGVTALSNGNYVVASPAASENNEVSAGAVTWVNGDTGLVSVVSGINSLIGTSSIDSIGAGIDGRGVTALRNGNYVVSSPFWSNGATSHVGAVTWGNGNTGIAGAVSPSNSLVGTAENDDVGIDKIAALSNGNYVVGSHYWHNGAAATAGAVTWADGSVGLSGFVSTGNSLVGATAGDGVGFNGIRALSNGNYVVDSARWSDGTWGGAITWADGSVGLVGAVSAANSLVGLPGDGIGASGVTALTNGNYVVGSPFWNNGAVLQAGAVTWAGGLTGQASIVDTGNSLVGTTTNDQIGYNFAIGLSNGNYVVASPGWSNGAIASVGAVTWGSGRTGISGPVSAGNSLIGISAGDSIGSGYDHAIGFATYSNGTYVVGSPHFQNGSIVDAGAVSLIRPSGGTVGIVSTGNSVIGTTAGGGPAMVFAYDATRDTLVVGQPASNIVSVFKADLLFANGFQ